MNINTTESTVLITFDDGKHEYLHRKPHEGLAEWYERTFRWIADKLGYADLVTPPIESRLVWKTPDFSTAHPWQWKMEWCRLNGLAPAKTEIWRMAGLALEEHIKK